MRKVDSQRYRYLLPSVVAGIVVATIAIALELTGVSLYAIIVIVGIGLLSVGIVLDLRPKERS